MKGFLPTGKLPPELLAGLLARSPVADPRVLLGPGVGLDCAVVESGPDLLVFKSDPITFASDQIGWYAVQVAANDIATTGAAPRWLLTSLLLPEGRTTPELVAEIMAQITGACREHRIALIGGHSEITYGLDRPIVVATLVGEVPRQKLITPRGATPGDRVLLTKGIPIEATAILARERADHLAGVLSPAELEQARAFLYRPGISVVRDAQVATAAGKVTAMHDPTEGGLATGLWELAEASGLRLHFDPSAVPVPPLAQRICQASGLNPLGAIASGALLLTAPPGEAEAIRRSLEAEGITCAEIGRMEAGPFAVVIPEPHGVGLLPRPERDEIARLFESGG